ncbi:MAG: SHOCT domain-containing protein [Gemmatimonadetes bacterium]|nr:SHOCT domain-containing protein [Gemmatimonadota bacterium]
MHPNAIYDSGLFMGMHWAWWAFATGTLLVLIWGFWMAFADRGSTHRKKATRETAEEVLRRRFAQGEISEERFAEALRVLREAR